MCVWIRGAAIAPLAAVSSGHKLTLFSQCEGVSKNSCNICKNYKTVTILYVQNNTLTIFRLGVSDLGKSNWSSFWPPTQAPPRLQLCGAASGWLPPRSQNCNQRAKLVKNLSDQRSQWLKLCSAAASTSSRSRILILSITNTGVFVIGKGCKKNTDKLT